MLPMNLINQLFCIVSMLLILLTYMYFMLFFKLKSKKNMKKEKIVKLKLSLFLSFDPNSTMIFFFFNEINWFYCSMFLILIILNFWNIPSRTMKIYLFIFFEMKNQLYMNFKNKKDGSMLIFLTLFLLIFLINFMGLNSFSFTNSSHLTFNLMIALPIWLGSYIFGWLIYTNKMFSHLVPQGTPIMLISFMVFIELISSLIRPFTLSIRLMANMVAGHLLLTLMGNTMSLKSPLMVLILSLTQSILTILEISVSFIQSYVFCILLSIYLNDSDYSKDN